jgi:predicted porin
MQKKLIALAVAGAAAGFASAPVLAQSNVSVYGVIDQALTTQSQANGGNVTSLVSGGYTTERLGFKGSEEIGTGLKANFVLELGMHSPSGNLDNTRNQLFQRMSTVGLSGANWGEVNFGRMYTPLFSIQAMNDLFRVVGIGTIYSLTNVGLTRASNAVRYDSPSWNGLRLGAMYGLGDTGSGDPSTGAAFTTTVNGATVSGTYPKDQGRQAGLDVTYRNGPLALGAGYSKYYETALDKNLQWDSQKTWAVTGSYDFKVVAIQAGWQENKIDDNMQDRTVWNVGATVPVFGADLVKLQYSDRHDKLISSGDSKLTALGYVHPMSKRTTLYGTYAKLDNDSNVAQGIILGVSGLNITPGYSPDGFQVGLAHEF